MYPNSCLFICKNHWTPKSQNSDPWSLVHTHLVENLSLLLSFKLAIDEFIRILAWEIPILFYFAFSKNHFIIISYHFTIFSTFQNYIFIKILFFNFSLLFFSNHHFFLDLVFRFPTVIFFPFFLPQPLAPVQHTKPHTHTPMIHWSTYPNPSPHRATHTHTNTNHQTFNRATHTQTIKPVGANNGDHTHHPSHRSTNPSNRSETHAANLKPRPSKIPRKTLMINPEKRQKYPSHQSETHATDFRKYPEKCRWSIQKKS